MTKLRDRIKNIEKTLSKIKKLRLKNRNEIDQGYRLVKELAVQTLTLEREYYWIATRSITAETAKLQHYNQRDHH